MARGCGGVTLVELVMTIAIAAILMSVAVPSFHSIMRANRISALTNDISTAFQLARSEAVTRGRLVTVCKSDKVMEASDDDVLCNASASWQDGWLIFVDENRNGIRESTETEILGVGQPSIEAATISGDANFASYVSYRADGVSDGASSTDDVGGGKISICLDGEAREVNIGRTGRISITSGTCP